MQKQKKNVKYNTVYLAYSNPEDCIAIGKDTTMSIFVHLT